MKHFLFATLLLITLSGSAFADPGNENSIAASNFRRDFNDATNVTWTVEKDYSKAAFTWNNVKMEAFYDHTGEMLGTSTKITLNELPVSAKRTFAKRFEGYTVKEAIHFQGVDETAYYISAENENESVILKVNNSQQVSVFKKTKK